MMQKPDVDLIEGLSPAISIEQKTTSRNQLPSAPSQGYDYRALWAQSVSRTRRPPAFPSDQTVSQMVDILLGMYDGTRLIFLPR